MEGPLGGQTSYNRKHEIGGANLAAITQAGSIGKELNAAVLGMDTASRLVREQLKTSRLFNERFHLGIDPKIFSSIGKFPELSSLHATTMSKVLADLE